VISTKKLKLRFTAQMLGLWQSSTSTQSGTEMTSLGFSLLVAPGLGNHVSDAVLQWSDTVDSDLQSLNTSWHQGLEFLLMDPSGQWGLDSKQSLLDETVEEQKSKIGG